MNPRDLFFATLESHPDGMLWLDSHGAIVAANAAAATLLGYTAEELRRRTAFQLRADLTAEAWDGWWEKIKGLGTAVESATLVSHDGKSLRLPVRSSRAQLPDKSEYVCWTCLPPEPAVQANMPGRLSAEFYESIFDFIGDPIFVKDHQGRIVMLNEANCRTMGRRRDQVLGLSDYDIFPKEEADFFVERDQRVFRTGQEDITEEKFTAADGQTITILTRKKLYVDTTGEPFVVGLFKDISPLKRVEAALQKANESLEEKIRERTAELTQANADMKVRIEQLNYLHDKGRRFAQLLDRKEVLTEIHATFEERFPGCPVHVIERDGAGYRSARHSRELEPYLGQCLQFLHQERAYDERRISVKSHGIALRALSPGFPGCIWIPFFSGTGFLGGAQVFVTEGYASRFAGDLTMLGTLSTQASIALDNANHILALNERTMIESELRVAKKIQMHYTPETPAINNIRLNGVCLPAREIGGDYLDYFQNENGDWVIVIADVCGKGIPAALVMTSLRSCVRMEGRRETSPKRLLMAVNRQMGAELQREKSFVTCLCLIISSRGDRISLSRAGHPQLIAYGGALSAPHAIPAKGVALGLVQGSRFSSLLEEVSMPLALGDKFFAYTDGVDEAMDQDKQPYGKRRLIEILEKNGGLPPNKLIQEVLKDVQDHVRRHRQYDDMTMLSFERCA